MQVTLGRVLTAIKSSSVAGIDNRPQAIDLIQRGLDLAMWKANWNPYLGVIDICSDACGFVTLPSFVETVLQVNVGGYPTLFRNDWFRFHINGIGDACGPSIGYVDDLMWSPVFQDIKEWSAVCAICEDPIDGNGTLEMIVRGETQDANYNDKEALTIPPSGPSHPGIRIPLLNGIANTPTPLVWLRNVTQVTKPVTRGYVKLIAFPVRQFAQQTTLGYYSPNETNPRYRRIRVGQKCKWCRIRFRRETIHLVDDSDIVPIASLEAMVDLIKSIRFSDSNRPDDAEIYLQRAVRLLNEIQSVQSGSTFSPIAIDPSFGIGTIDLR